MLARRPFAFGVSSSGFGAEVFEGGVGAGAAEVVLVLEVEPELCGEAEVDAEAEGGVGADGALAAQDFADARLGNFNVLGDAVSGEAHGLKEFGKENCAGVDECVVDGHCCLRFLDSTR